ncbi:MAG: glutamine--fructose-6-phosphate aminotransferase, partial [Deltaproteobacteria bacterium]
QQDKMKNTLQEVKSRGAFIWTWGADTPYFRQESHEFTPLPSSHRFTEPILHTVLGQLFAYHLAHLKGAEIDKPRNLAKSVTVE